MTTQIPCTWTTSYAACNGGCDAYSQWPEGEAREFAIASAENLATTFLRAATDRRYGVCTREIRPCRGDSISSSISARSRARLPPFSAILDRTSQPTWQPVLIDGVWKNLYCGTCVDSGCGCEPNGATSLRLPGNPSSIVSILVDGVELSEAAYRLSNGILYRLDGQAWPSTQRLDLSPEQPGTWQITYLDGIEPPLGGQVSAGMLACEFAKALCNDNSCQLPRRVQTLVRQDVTIGFRDNFDNLDKKRTGLFLVDSWIAAVSMDSASQLAGGVVASPQGYGPRLRKF